MNKNAEIFFAMPNDGSCESLWRNLLEPAAVKLGVSAVRIRLHPTRCDVLSKMKGRIDSCDVFVGVVLARNANVFLEIGYALAKEKPCLVLAAPDATGEFFDSSAKVVLVEEPCSHLRTNFEAALMELMSVKPNKRDVRPAEALASE